MSDKREPIEFDGETFHPVPGDEVAYASEGGRIAFRDAREGGRFRLSYKRMLAGTLRVWYFVGEKRRDRHAARLIWRTFRGETPRDQVVETIGDASDVSLNNLHLRPMYEVSGGLRGSRSKLSSRQVLDIRARSTESQAALAKEYGVAVSSIYGIRKGHTYRDVASSEHPPATDEQRERIGNRMRSVGIGEGFISYAMDRLERDGRIRLRESEAAAYGLLPYHRIQAIRAAIRHGLMSRSGAIYYRVSVDMPDHVWQSHLEDLVLTQHQREVLSVRVSRALASDPEVPKEVVESVVGSTSIEGVFAKKAIAKACFSHDQYRSTMGLLLDSGVVQRRNQHSLTFVEMPGRTHTHGREGARVKPVEPSSSGYREAVRMLVRGDDLSAVAYESGVPAAVAQKMARALSMDIVARQLLASGKQSQLPRLLGLPEPAAKAIAEHVSRSNHTDIQSPIR